MEELQEAIHFEASRVSEAFTAAVVFTEVVASMAAVAMAVEATDSFAGG